MKKNIGPKNRAARFIAGALLIGASMYLDDVWMIAGAAIGALMIIEAAAGFCVWHTVRGTSDMR